MTLLEVIVVIGILIVLLLLILGAYAGPAARLKAQKIRCTSNLKQLGMAFRVWEGDDLDLYPMSVSLTNGVVMELIQNGNVLWVFKVMSNEISAPQLLHCPADKAHFAAETFGQLSNSNISYFLNLDASEANPQAVLTGDSNLKINGQPVKSGLVSIRTNDAVAWQSNRHGASGNIGIADGSVQSASLRSLQIYFNKAATNRIAIP